MKRVLQELMVVRESFQYPVTHGEHLQVPHIKKIFACVQLPSSFILRPLKTAVKRKIKTTTNAQGFQVLVFAKNKKGWRGMAKEDRKKKGRWKWPCPKNQLIRIHYESRGRRESFNIGESDTASVKLVQIYEKNLKRRGRRRWFDCFSGVKQFGEGWRSFWRNGWKF